MKPNNHDHVGKIDWSEFPLIQCSGCDQKWFFDRGWKPVPYWFELPDEKPEINDPYKEFLRRQTPERKPIKIPKKRN